LAALAHRAEGLFFRWTSAEQRESPEIAGRNTKANIFCKVSTRFEATVERNVYRLLVGKPEGKRPLGRPRRRWIDNIKMYLLEKGVNVVDWIGLAQDMYRWRALVNSVMNLRVP
jgi:hypothetical protein